MIVFKSKIDFWLASIIFSTAFFCVAIVVPMMVRGDLENWILSFMIVILGVVLPLWLLTSTKYKLTEELFHIYCGPFRWDIKLESIQSIEETHNTLSSPALSLDRLRIAYDQDKTIMISPVQKQGFVNVIGHHLSTLKNQ